MMLYSKTKTFFATRPNLSFFLILAIISLFYNSYSIIFKTTYSAHQWRQADCLTITESYYKDKAPFLEPNIKWISKSNDSKVISEFPIIYYTVGNIWKVTGKKEFIFRLIDLSIVIIGLFLLFRILLSIFDDKYWAFFIPIFLYSSEILVYYANNYLMNAPAFGVMLIAWFFYWKFYKEEKNIFIIISMTLFLLAGLLKITSLISFIALLVISGANLLKIPYFKDIKLPTKPVYYFSFLIVLIGIPLWYSYTRSFNTQHLPFIFLQDIFPIWDLDAAKKHEVWRTFKHDLLPRYLNKTVLITIILGFIILLKDFKKASKFWTSMSILVITGSLIYIILWYKAFDVHDYYLINLLVIIPFVLTSIGIHLQKYYPKLIKNIIFKYFTFVVLLYMIYGTAIANRMKYKPDDIFVKQSSFLLRSDVIKNWDRYHYNYKNHFKALNELEPIMEKIGISKDDTIVSIPDQSINISLYLLDRRGFSSYGYDNIPDSIALEYFRDRGAKYLILNDTNISPTSWINELYNKKIATYKNINIYDLR